MYKPAWEIRKAYSLVSYWDETGFVIENYLANTQVACNPLLLQIVEAAKSFIPVPALEEKFSYVPQIKDILDTLLIQKILLKQGSVTEKKDALLNNIWKWKHDAKFFHFATKAVNYSFNFQKLRKVFEKKALVDPPPSPFKTEGSGNKIPLIKPDLPQRDFWETLYSRRTCRDFQDAAISKELFSALLTTVAGMTHFYNDSVLDRRIIKTSPSGGARHPIEVYPVVRNVTGIPKAIYHFEVETNSLRYINKYPGEEVLNNLFSGQEWVKKAAAAFIFTAILPRSMWKYDHSRAYRVVLLDAGHIGQTFHLSATALNLGVFTTAAIQDKKIEKYINIDGISEIVMYAGAIGNKNDLA
ncbi:MAG: SagB-type dehydrogenase protein [Chitinophagaceae bacterium]|nr:SagB-type dehydrogenase protein [Chitinophagaceae bacterium]